MSLRPCSACNQRKLGEKLASVYWSWNRADRSRAAWLQRLCIGCFILRVMPLQDEDHSEAILCPMCHTPSVDDMDPVFARVYVPGQHDSALELPTCPKCAVALRTEAMEGSEPLPDRQAQVGGQAPNLTGTSVWDSLGLRPS
jgi:hypothetical protein